MTVRVPVGDHFLETEWIGPGPNEAPTLVFLHEGLGSVSTWRSFPRELAAAAGMGALVFSRRGYGGSDPAALPRPLRYMEEEGLAELPLVLDRFAIERAVLFGHSDGASIALVHASAHAADPRHRALVLEAPHVFTEPPGLASIEKAKIAFETTDLRARLERHHGANVDGAFWGWNRAWLDPGFRSFNLEGYLPDIRVPVLVVQGKDDEFGTLAQVDAIERGVRAPFERAVFDACGHAPHRDQAQKTREVVLRFLGGISW